MKYPLPTVQEIARYADAADAAPRILQFGREVRELGGAEADLRGRRDAAAAMAAAGLRTSLLRFAAVPAANARRLSRKARALSAELIAASGLGPLGADMIKAALEADAANLRIDAARAHAEPSYAEMLLYNGEVYPSPSNALCDYDELRHDQAFLAANGDHVGAARLAARRGLELVRAASRPAEERRSAEDKLDVISRHSVVAQPILAEMLAVAADLELDAWDIGDIETIGWWHHEDPSARQGAAERCASKERSTDPFSPEPWIGIAEAYGSRFEVLVNQNDFRARGCLRLIVDAGLMAAAIPAATRGSAARKLEFLDDLLDHLKRCLWGEWVLSIAMLDVAIRSECGKWGVQTTDAAERKPGQPSGGAAGGTPFVRSSTAASLH